MLIKRCDVLLIHCPSTLRLHRSAQLVPIRTTAAHLLEHATLGKQCLRGVHFHDPPSFTEHHNPIVVDDRLQAVRNRDHKRPRKFLTNGLLYLFEMYENRLICTKLCAKQVQHSPDHQAGHRSETSPHRGLLLGTFEGWPSPTQQVVVPRRLATLLARWPNQGRLYPASALRRTG